jgi:hypothetical protein
MQVSRRQPGHVALSDYPSFGIVTQTRGAAPAPRCKPREVEHDSQVFNGYLREAEKLSERGARVDRIVSDYELKREYRSDRVFVS